MEVFSILENIFISRKCVNMGDSFRIQDLIKYFFYLMSRFICISKGKVIILNRRIPFPRYKEGKDFFIIFFFRSPFYIIGTRVITIFELKSFIFKSNINSYRILFINSLLASLDR